ncbi:MAG: D-inositol-3-phosphate glycosyltransferase [Actinomycetota bacterium]|nr:D-inositol-3-phosphate glycosyltransferase [Actinomycetota bacterium]
MVSVHTSPLEQPGTGDAGGMNVYVAEVAQELARRGVEVDIFTRATTGSTPTVVEMAPGVRVGHITAGPYEGLGKADLPGQLCAFAAGVMRAAAARPEGWYDVLHSHYWLSGQVGWLAADRWGVPLVHSMHTMARVKNRHLPTADTPEPPGREIGEVQVVEAADRLVANTQGEADDLVDLYAADPAKVRVVAPGVDLDVFTPGDRASARAEVGLPPDAVVLLFVGRIQPLKRPDLVLRVGAELRRRHIGRPGWGDRLVLAVLGGPSGSGLDRPEELERLAADLGVTAQTRFVPPVPRAELARWYRAADLLLVPSHSESFGLVAVEAEACGTPVVAARVGGLPMAVGDTGALLDGHEVADWTDAVEALLDDPTRRADLGRRAAAYARGFGWGATTDRLLDVYAEARFARTRTVLDPFAVLADAPTALIP